MINSEIVNLFQQVGNTIINEENSDYSDITLECNDEVDYEFFEANEKLVQCNFLFGSATQDNDLAKKFTQNFVINIQSELNGSIKAIGLFNEIFISLNRKMVILGDYNAKIILGSPTFIGQKQVNNGYACLYTMSGTVEFSEELILGATFKLLKLGNGSGLGTAQQPTQIYPRQPKVVKDAQGGNDTQVFSSNKKTIFNKSSSVITTNFVMLLDDSTLALALLDECFGDTNNKYELTITIGQIEKTLTNLVVTRAEYIYDENTGDNVLSFSLNEGV